MSQISKLIALSYSAQYVSEKYQEWLLNNDKKVVFDMQMSLNLLSDNINLTALFQTKENNHQITQAINHIDDIEA
jgi:hypothetical protein